MVDMPDLSEMGVLGLLEYLYTNEITSACSNSNISVEIFEAAHAYELGALERKIKTFLSDQTADWFEVDAALRLFRYVQKVECCKDMKTKIGQILKS